MVFGSTLLSATDGGKMGEKKQKLPKCLLLNASFEEILCGLLKVDTAEWQAIKALFAAGTAWTIHKIPKKRGERIIHVPSDPLKKVSRGILTQLLQGMPVHTAVHGAHPRTSIITNARVHAGFGRSFYQLDLKDAFPSTERVRVTECLRPRLVSHISDSTGLEEKQTAQLADTIIELLLVDDAIPQGFPTSPAVLNLVLLPVDQEISRILREKTKESGISYRYTRFVDDLTISTDAEEISRKLRQRIRRVIEHAGWTIQGTKLSYFGDAEEGDGERTTKYPVVTGLIPNPDGRVTIPRSRLNKFRAILHSLSETAKARETGDEKALETAREQMKKDIARIALTGINVDPETPIAEFYGRDWPLTTREHRLLVGIIGFVSMVYDQEPPSVIRKPYLEAKSRFRIGFKDLPDHIGYDAGSCEIV